MQGKHHGIVVLTGHRHGMYGHAPGNSHEEELADQFYPCLLNIQ